MGNRVVFTFAGTGCAAENMRNYNEQFIDNPDVVRVYFAGCHDRAIGGKPNSKIMISKNYSTTLTTSII